MRKLFFIAFLILIALNGMSQKLDFQLNHVDPIVQSDSHGDTLRKYFSITFYRFPESDTSAAIRTAQKPRLQMNAYYSNKLAVHYYYALKKIPELNHYANEGLDFVMQFGDSYTGSYAIPIFDSSGIIITVNGINHQNADQYQFRVLENKTKVVLPWIKPKLFSNWYWSTRIADPQKRDEDIAYLGQFKDSWGKSLTFQVRRVDNPNTIQVAMSALWVKWQPKVIAVFAFNQLDDFLKIVKRQWMPVISPDKNEWGADSVLLHVKHNFAHTENSLIFYLDGIVKNKKIIEYELMNGQTASGWHSNDFDFNFIWLKDLSPGHYKLRIRYSVQRDIVTEFPFTISPAWYQTGWASILYGFLFVIGVGFIVLLIRSSRQSKKLAAQGIQKQIVQTELKAIRSQFNPHFVFNALNSIQGLITKNDQENATKYLVDFGTLMRDALKASSREFTNVAGEIKILENYIRLEQLRFGFQYEFKVDKNLSINDVDIPSLLLQPIIENAIKHGISPLQENGRLMVTFERTATDMIVTVIDNGAGFKDEKAGDGFGLQLTRDRIKFLNQTFEGQEITFDIRRIDQKTHVIICFKNLLI